MTDEAPWSDRVRLDQIGSGVSRRLVADAASRGRIATALDLVSLDRLEAHVEIKPAGRGWRLAGNLSAAVVQTCGVTLEPLPAEVTNAFSVDLRETSAEPPRARVIDADPEAPDSPDLIEDGGVDLAAYVVEHLALALDPWPRKPGAVFEPPQGPAEPSPFDILKDFTPKG